MLTPWQQLADLSGPASPTIDLAPGQQKWLLECLSRNQSSVYGSAHHFSRISTIADFQRQVPIVSYEDIQPYIDDMERGRQDCLFSGSPVAFERTSGTHSGQKLVPYSAHSLSDFRRAILPWLSGLARHYKIETGYAYWAISPATRQPEITSAGVPIGLPDAAYLGDEMLPFFRDVSAVPAWAGTIEAVSDWQLATLYYLICSRELVVISVWSPTFLIALTDALVSRENEIETILSNGLEICGQSLAANRSALERYQDFVAHYNVRILWPDLKLISCWADASSKPFTEQIRQLFSGVPIQSKGLLMTEGVVTTPDNLGNTVLAVNSGFYEFIDQNQKLKLAQELQAGEEYELIMTTSGGLYRYKTGDLVCCEGYAGDLPVLRFIGRKASTDLVGEKITEAFANACLDDISGFRMLLPIAEKAPGYVLVLDKQPDTETLIRRVEARLCENPQYAYARKMGQLKPLAASPMENPLQIYLGSRMHGNARLGDIKVPSLCINTSIFDGHIGSPE